MVVLAAMMVGPLLAVVNPLPEVGFDSAASDAAAAETVAASSTQTVLAGQVPDGFTAEEWASVQAQIPGLQAPVLDIAPAAVNLTPPTSLTAGLAGLQSPGLSSPSVAGTFAPGMAVFASVAAPDAPVIGFSTSQIGDLTLGATPSLATIAGIEYRHAAGVTEWFRETPSGLQQGFTLAQPVTEQAATVISVAVASGTPRLIDDQTVAIKRAGATDLLYSGLLAWDANGVDLPAAMTVVDGAITLTVQTAGAAYPVTIDPTITEDFTVNPLSNASGELSGQAVAIDTDTVIVSSPNDDDAGLDRGKVEVWDYTVGTGAVSFDSSWPGGTNSDSDYGFSLDIEGDTFVVGAPGDSGEGADAGAVYVYKRTSPGNPWALAATLYACSGAFCSTTTTGGGVVGDRFGEAVAISDDEARLVVGAPQTGLATNGRAFVIELDTYTVETTLTDPLADNGNGFGSSVDIAADRSMIVVGAPLTDAGQTDSGRAYVFEDLAPWTRTLVITAATYGEEANGYFGAAVAVEHTTDSYVVVTEPGGNGGTGTFFVVDVVNAQTFGFSTSNVLAFAGVADSVSAEGAFAVVGTSTEGTNGTLSILERTGSFTFSETIETPTVGAGETGAAIGTSVSIGSGGSVAYGVPLADGTNEIDGGIARVWDNVSSLPATESTIDSPIDDSIGDQFGFTVALDGNQMAVAAVADDEPTGRSGSVQIFDRTAPGNPWTFRVIINDPNPTADGFFGDALELNGATLAIGKSDRHGDQTDAGEVSVFTGSGASWSLSAGTPLTSGLGSYDAFGAALDLPDETTLVIGAPEAAGTGMVYTSTFGASWSAPLPVTYITPPAAGDQLGYSVDSYATASGYVLAAGAPGDDNAGIDAGAVWIHEDTGGGLTLAQVQANDSNWDNGDRVGVSVAADHGRIVAGGLGDQTIGADYGVHVIEPSGPGTWTVTQDITGLLTSALVPAPNDFVDIYGGTIALARPGGGGQVDLFRHNGVAFSTSPDDTIIPTGTVAGDRVGYSVDIDGRDVAVGIPGDDTNGADAGLAVTVEIPLVATMELGPDWFTAANWDTNEVPGSGDVAIISPSLGVINGIVGSTRIGELVVGTGSTVTVNPVDQLTIEGIIGAATVPSTINGTLDVPVGAQLFIETNLLNTGTIIAGGEVTLSTNIANTGTLNVPVGGVLTIDGAGDRTIAGAVVLDGTLNKNTAGAVSFANSGSVTTSSSSVTNVNAGSLGYDGIHFEDGTVNVAAGTTVGYADNGAFDAGATYNIEITGPAADTANFGRVLWIGLTTISGTVNSTLVGYTPGVGETYNVITCAGNDCDGGLAGSNTPQFSVNVTPVAVQLVGAPGSCGTEWTGTAGDDLWSTSGNWSAGLPGAADVVCMDVAATATVTVDGIQEIGSFDTAQENMSISGSLTVNDASISDGFVTVTGTLDGGAGLTLNSGAQLNGGTLLGNITVPAAEQLDISTGTIDGTNGGTLTNEGLITVTSSPLLIASGADIVNNGDLAWVVASFQEIQISNPLDTSTITNNGVIRKSGSSNLLIPSGIDIDMMPGSTISARFSGDIDYFADGTWDGSGAGITVEVDDGSDLNWSGAQDISGTITGTHNTGSPGFVVMNGIPNTLAGTTLDFPADMLQISGALFTGTGTVELPTNATVNSGTTFDVDVINNGTLTFEGAATINGDINTTASATVEIGGNAAYTLGGIGFVDFSSGGLAVTNLSSSGVTIGSGLTLSIDSLSTMDLGPGTFTINSNFTNAGAINLSSGTLLSTGGAVTLDTSSVVTFDISGPPSGGPTNFSQWAVVAGVGTLDIGGELALSGGYTPTGAETYALITNCNCQSDTFDTLNIAPSTIDIGINNIILAGPVCATEWTNGSSDGLWTTAANWTAGVPGPVDVVCMDVLGDDPVLINGAGGFKEILRFETAEEPLTINGQLKINEASTINGEVIVAGRLEPVQEVTLAGGGTIGGFLTGPTRVPLGATVNFADLSGGIVTGIDIEAPTTLTNEGIIQISYLTRVDTGASIVNDDHLVLSEAMTLEPGGSIVNNGMIEFFANTVDTPASGGGTITNNGVLQKTGAQQATISVAVLDMTTGSSLEATQGTLDITSGGTWGVAAGTLIVRVDSGAVVNLGGDQNFSGTLSGQFSTPSPGKIALTGIKTSTTSTTLNFPESPLNPGFANAYMLEWGAVDFRGDPWTFDGFARIFNGSPTSNAVLTIPPTGEVAQQWTSFTVDGSMANNGTYRSIGSANDTLEGTGTWTNVGVFRRDFVGGNTYSINIANWAEMPSSSVEVVGDTGLTINSTVGTLLGSFTIAPGSLLTIANPTTVGSSAVFDLGIDGASTPADNYASVNFGSAPTIDPVATLRTSITTYAPIATDAYAVVDCGAATCPSFTVTDTAPLEQSEVAGDIVLALPVAPVAADPSVAIDGEWAVIGVPAQDQVFVMRKVAGVWTDVQTINASVAGGFGTTLALSTPYLVIGSPDIGRVDYYQLSGGTFNVSFAQASDPGYGQSLDMDDGVLIIGSPNENGGGLGGGNAFLWDLPTSTPLVPGFLEGLAGDEFGSRVAVAGGNVWVAAPFADPGGLIDAGAVYRYDFGGTLLETITAPAPTAGANFGIELDAINSRVAIGIGTSISVVIDDVAGGQTTIDGASTGYGYQIAMNGDVLAVNDVGDVVGHIYGDNGADGTYAELQQPAILGSDVATDGGTVVWVEYPAATVTSGNDIATFLSSPIVTPADKVLPEIGSARDRFGTTVAIDGDLMAVSAPGFDADSRDVGRIYIFKRITGEWIQETFISGTALGTALAVDGNVIASTIGLQVAITTDLGGGTYGGEIPIGGLTSSPRTIAIDGDTLVLGMPAEGGNEGATWIYTGGAANWSADTPQIITADAPRPVTDRYGHAVAIDGNTLVVGAPAASSVSAALGAAGYMEIWTRPDAASDFVFVQTVENAVNDDLFGWAVAVDNDIVAAGSPATNSVHVYDVAGTELGVAPSGLGALFGYAIAMDSGILAVGDWNGQVTSYYVDATGATFEQLDVASDFEAQDASNGTTTLGLSNGTIVRGHRLEDQQGSDAGAVYQFAVAVPEPANKIIDQSANALAGDLFGFDIAVSGDVMVVGAPQDIGFAGTTGDLGNGGSGEIHIFDRVAGDWVYNRTIDAPVGPPGNLNDAFGRTVDISGDWIVVGAPRTNDPGDTTGRVHFIDTANADVIQTVAPPGPPDVNVNFGIRVAIDGTTAVIGASTWGASDGGQVLIYELQTGTWTLVEQYRASGGYRLGRGVDIDGDRIAFGTLNNAGGGFVVIADRVGGVWPIQTDPFNTTDLQPNFDMVFNNVSGSQFGVDVALDGDNLLIGAPNASGTGLVEYRTFNGSSWDLAQTMTPTTALAYESFGYAVDLDGQVAAIGARRSDTAAGSEAGAAFVFNESAGTFTQVDELLAPDAAANDNFGFEVKIDGAEVLIGAPGDNNGNGADAGGVYTFEIAVPAPDGRIYAPDAAAGDYFGQSVDVHENWMVIGARQGDGDVVDSGSAYVFTRAFETADWTFVTELEAPAGVAGQWFGNSVAISGTRIEPDGDLGNMVIAVGAPDLFGATSGAVHMFRYDFVTADWVQTEEISAPGSAVDFGYSVDLQQVSSAFRNGSYVMAVGAPAAFGAGPGSAHLYSYRITENPTQSDTLTVLGVLDPPTPTAGARHGFSVAVDGDSVIVGESFAPVAGAALAGQAHVYTYTTTPAAISFQATLAQPAGDVVAGDGMGHAVDIDGDLAVVTAFFDSTNGTAAGAAYAFRRTGATWSSAQQLDTDQTGDNYGSNAAVQDGTIVVSSFSGGTADDGTVQVFGEDPSDGWVTTTAFQWEAGSGDTGMGSGLALGEDGTLVVGTAEDDNAAGTDAGAVHMFGRLSLNTPGNKVLAGLADEPAGVGNDVSVNGEWAFVGSDAGITTVLRNVAGEWQLFDQLTTGGITAVGGTWAATATASTTDVYEFNGIAWVPAFAIAAGADAIMIDGFNSRMITTDVGATGTVLVWDLSLGISGSFGTSVTGNQTGIGWGTSAAIDGDFAFVGAPGEGSVTVLELVGATWNEVDRIQSPVAPGVGNYGISIDAADGRLIVGESTSSSAFVYENVAGTWTNTAQLNAGAPQFGTSVAISGDVAVLGSPRTTVDNVWAGSAASFVLVGSTWVLSETVSAPDREFGDAFGSSVALDGIDLVVGSPLDTNFDGVGAGAAYVFTVAPADNPVVTFDLVLSSPGTVTVAPSGLAATDFDASVVESGTANESSIGSTPLSTIDLADTALADITIGQTPLSTIVLGSTPLSTIPLVNIDVDGGWDDLIAGTDFENVPLVDLSFGEVLADPVVRGRIEALPLSTIGVDGTPLSTIPLSTIALGETPLSTIPLSTIGLDWCDIVSPYFPAGTCTDESDLSSISLMEATLAGTPLSTIPLSTIPLSTIPLSTIPLSTIPLSTINFQATPLSTIPLSTIPLSTIGLDATPLSTIPLSTIPLSTIPLSTIPLSTIGLGATPLSTIGVNGAPLSTIPVSIPLSTIPLSTIGIESTPLSTIPLSTIVLAEAPLSTIPLSTIGGAPLDWCTVLANGGHGIDCENGVDPATTTLAELSVRGVPLSTIPLSTIPLSTINLSGTPLSTIPLSTIPLSTISLEAVPLSTIDLQGTPLSTIDPGATPLSTIPLSTIPLSTIDIVGSPLSTIPLSTIPLSTIGLDTTPLSTIPLSTIPLSTIPLSTIDLGPSPLSTIPLSTIDIVGSPLSTIPLSTIPLSTIAVDCSRVNCDVDSLGDAVAAGAVDLAATLADLQPALGGYRLGDIASSIDGFTAADVVAALEASGVTLGDLAGLDDVTLGEIPSYLLDLDNVTLDDLGGALFDVSLGDLVGALIDPNTGDPYPEADARAALEAAIAGLGLNIGDVDALGDATLGELLEGGPNVLLGDLGAILGFVSVQSIVDFLGLSTPTVNGTLGDLDPAELGRLVLGSLFGNGAVAFDTVQLGELLQDLDNQGLLEGFTLGDLLLALVGAGDLPFGGFSFADVEVGDLPPGTVPAVSLSASFSVDSSVERTVEVSIDIPATATYVPGAEFTVTSGALPPVTVPSEPVVDGNRLSWTFSQVTPNDNYDIAFQVLPTVTLGSTSMDGTARVLGTDVSVPANATVQVAEGLEPNDFQPETTLVDPDTIYLTYISDATDIDVFELTLQDNDVLAVELSNLSADLDLALYVDPSNDSVGSALAGTNGNDPVIPVTDPDQNGVDAEPLDDFLRLDTLNPDLQLLEVSNARGTETEFISTEGLPEGTYYLQVFGANGQTTVAPAALQIQVNEAENRPECQPIGALPAATFGTTNTVTATTNTLFLVNEMRLEQFHSAGERTQVMAELNELASYLSANPALGIDPAIVAVDSVPAIRSAYNDWDNPANPDSACDPEVANNVVSSINGTIVDPIRDQIDFIVIIGGDEQIPMARLQDATAVANEYDYRHEFDGDLAGVDPDAANAFSSVFWESRFLSDEPYGESAAQSLGSRYLYVSDVALGRLVESPADIVKSLDDFVVHQGSLDISSASVLGYDFLIDGSEEIADDLTSNGIATDATLADGIDDTDGQPWDRSDAEGALAAAGSNSLISLNAHFDHYRALPAAGDQVPGFSDNLIASDVGLQLGFDGLAQSVLFSMGCHSGLAVPDNLIDITNEDWAETIAGTGGVYVANTGFGYGDTEAVAYTEQLMALFAENASLPTDVGGLPTTVGEALMFAKNQYAADLAVLSVYDEKALMESTFYGVPFYRTALPAAAEPPVPVNNPNPDPNGAPVVQISVDAVNDQNVTPSGTYYSNSDDDGDQQTIVAPGRPIQPSEAVDVSAIDLAGDTTELEQVAHGAILVDMTSTWVFEPNPVVSTPIFNESSGQPEPSVGDQTFPANPIAINTYLTPSGERQSLVLATGQYRSSTEAQRLDDDLDLVVYYAPVGATDFTEPSIGAVTSTLDNGLLTITLSASDDDAAGVERVFVLIAEEPGFGTVNWVGLDLANAGGNQWAGSIQLEAGTNDVEFIVQAKDPSGNVGLATNKANNFNDDGAPADPPPPTPDLEVEEDLQNLDVASGWYTDDATVIVDSGALDAEYSVDGAPLAPVPASDTFDIVGDGIHTWQVVTENGQTQTGVIRIDTTGPPEVLLGTPLQGGNYETGTANLDLLCRDPSLVSCDVAINGVPADLGDDLPIAPGGYVMQVAAADVFGNTTIENVAFDISAPVSAVPEIRLIDAPMTPQLISDGVFIDIEFDDADGSLDDYTVTIDWGDQDEDDPSSTATTCVARSSTPQSGVPACEIVSEPGAGTGVAVGEFTYAEPGVYAITVTVEDSAGNVDTSIYEFVVVYDPGAGRVSGAGWYWSGDEAYEDGDPSGNWAFFGYNARYRNDEETLRGRTKLHLRGEFFFKSTEYDYLIVNDTVATAEGTGKINGQSGYRFRVQGIDNGWVDFFQITIWDEATGEVVYDNGVLFDEGDVVLFGGIRVRS